MKVGKFKKFNFLCFLLISLPLTVADQITKQWALTLKNQPPIKVIEGFWNFVYVENSGALWGMGATLPPIYRKLIFVGLSILLTVFIIYLLFFYAETKLMAIVYSLIISGAIGNLIDRVVYGYVIDFIDWHAAGTYHWPTFNVADAAIVAGMVLFAIDIIFLEPKRRKKESDKGSDR